MIVSDETSSIRGVGGVGISMPMSSRDGRVVVAARSCARLPSYLERERLEHDDSDILWNGDLGSAV